MSRLFTMLSVLAMLVITCGNAAADSIKGRLGITGRIGFINPSNSDLNGFRRNTDVGFVGGGGLIYGITDAIALDLDITHAGYSAKDNSTGQNDFDTTNLSFGAQYRILNVPLKKLVPYVGIGMDILLNGIGTSGLAVDNVVGMHVKGGVDYFVLKELAITGEVKGVVAPDADITDATGRTLGKFDPTSLTVTFGVRYFFN